MGKSVGPFLLQKSLSSGGMGEVWRARLNEDGPEVAIKLLMNERLVDERFLSAFEREVRAVSGLVHSQVVRVHDYGLVTPEEAEKSDGLLQSGLPWLAMEMANGGALTALVENWHLTSASRCFWGCCVAWLMRILTM